jgi:predicted GNAT superfamily acetyltransferase
MIEGHLSSPETAWVDMILIPAQERGTGQGRRTYEAWEARLPATVEVVRLFAADTGSGESDGFWEAMSFEYQYDCEDESDLDYESSHMMFKGVNGHPTPKPIWV